tara:strand:+ start:3337 stop:3747 length:411 start_codon:yes stop_codon:yes gene_type:complete
MSDLAQDMYMMHDKFEVHQWFMANKENKELMSKYLDFRLAMCQEELTETVDAVKAKDPEEVVDGLIDLVVFALGTLDVFGVDTGTAWDAVYAANMAKHVGVKEGRPNPFGLPDLMKPEGWTAPSHAGNHGHINKAL